MWENRQCNSKQSSLLVFLFVYIQLTSTQLNWLGPNFFVGPRVTPGRVYEWSNFQKCASNKIRFLKILKINEFSFIKSAKYLFVFVLQRTQREQVHNWNRRWARSSVKASFSKTDQIPNVSNFQLLFKSPM